MRGLGVPAEGLGVPAKKFRLTYADPVYGAAVEAEAWGADALSAANAFRFANPGVGPVRAEEASE